MLEGPTKYNWHISRSWSQRTWLCKYAQYHLSLDILKWKWIISSKSMCYIAWCQNVNMFTPKILMWMKGNITKSNGFDTLRPLASSIGPLQIVYVAPNTIHSVVIYLAKYIFKMSQLSIFINMYGAFLFRYGCQEYTIQTPSKHMVICFLNMKNINWALTFCLSTITVYSCDSNNINNNNYKFKKIIFHVHHPQYLCHFPT